MEKDTERSPDQNIFHLSVKSMLNRIGELIIELNPNFFGYEVLDLEDDYSSTRQKIVLKRKGLDGTYVPMYDNYQLIGVAASLDMKTIVISQLLYRSEYVQPDEPGDNVVIQKFYEYMVEYLINKNDDDNNIHIKNFDVSKPNAGYVPSRRIQFSTDGFESSIKVMNNIFTNSEKENIIEVLKLLLI